MSKKQWSNIILALFCLAVFFITANSIPNIDTWFHIKSGEIISTQGLLSHDVFSQHAHDRPWYMHEWLFEVVLFWFTKATSVAAIPYFVGFVAVLHVLVLFVFNRKILQLHLLSNLFIISLYVLMLFNVFVPRPQLVGQLFLLINLLLVLAYVLKNKNLLWVSIPITYLWTLTHGSTILNDFIFVSYAILCVCYARFAHEKHVYQKARVLGLFAVGNIVVSFLPPTGMTQYNYLLLVAKHNDIFQQVSEWQPLVQFTGDFLHYIIVIGIIAVPISWYAWHNRKKEFLWFLPLGAFLLFGFTALRQAYFGYFAVVILLAWFLATVHSAKASIKRYLLVATCITLLLLEGYLTSQRVATVSGYDLEAETAFLQKVHLNGNMFNEYNLGSYLLYRLYPEYKVFIDGRQDVYLCCEEPDYFNLVNSTNLPQQAFKTKLDNVLAKYDTSFVIVSTSSSFGTAVLETLRQDPAWKLVFWSDTAIIFVKDDGKNNDVLDAYELKAAMPYTAQLMKDGMLDQARTEYLRMDAITRSSQTKNTLGFLAMQKGEINQAETYFRQAIDINPKFAKAYANLAEVMARQGKTQEAIDLYKQAIESAPDKAAYYLRLAAIYLSIEDMEQSKAVLQDGIGAVTDPNDQEILKSNLKVIE